MARKTAKKKALSDRIVYEVTTPKGSYQVEASATKELKTAITSLLPLPLEPYRVQAPRIWPTSNEPPCRGKAGVSAGLVSLASCLTPTSNLLPNSQPKRKQRCRLRKPPPSSRIPASSSTKMRLRRPQLSSKMLSTTLSVAATTAKPSRMRWRKLRETLTGVRLNKTSARSCKLQTL